MPDVTAIILTRNEAENIADCIASVKPLAARIVVVDSFSEDQTVEIAREQGADTYQHEFVHYGAQFRYALETCDIETQWVFRLDADERVSPETVAEISALVVEHADTDVNGFVFRLRNCFLGKEIKHGAISVLEKLCIFKFGKAYMEDRYLGEHIVLTEGRSIQLKSLSFHNGARSISYFVNKQNWYARREVKDYFAQQQKSQSLDGLDGPARLRRALKYGVYYKLPSRIRCSAVFFYWYVLRLGFLDGRAGFYWNYFTVYYYRTLIDALLFECLVTGREPGETGALTEL